VCVCVCTYIYIYVYRCCPANPNVSLQAGKGVPVGDGKVLI